MDSGIVNLDILIKITKKDKEGLALHGDSKHGRNYGQKASALCKTIPTDQGFYLFGKYIKKILWHSIYFGKAGTGNTTNLRARIREELADERAFMWFREIDRQKNNEEGNTEWIMDRMVEYYPLNTNLKESRYKKETIRALRKKGATHIIWVSMPDLNDNKRIEAIEADLIETLNPRANRQRSPKLDTGLMPDTGLMDETLKIIKKIKEKIHENRPARRKTSS